MTTRINTLGDINARRDEKRARYEDRATKAHQESDQHYQASRDIAKHIPFGQPILVGHHSEARSRRDAARINDNMRKSVEADKKASHYESKAVSVGSAGIASDDAQAIEKLQKKLLGLEAMQEKMKKTNAILRKKNLDMDQKRQALIDELGLTESQAKEIMTPDCMGDIGFAKYQLTNNNATIRNTRKRIEDLEKLHNAEVLSASGEIDGITWELFEDEGRVQVRFDENPGKEINTLLRSYGLVWSPSRKTSVRKITPNAIAAAQRLIARLQTL